MFICEISASFIPCICSGYSQIMPQAIMVLFVRFPYNIVEIGSHIAIIQCKINPRSLEKISQIKGLECEQVIPVGSHKSEFTIPSYN